MLLFTRNVGNERPPLADSVANRIIISSDGEVMRTVNMDVTRWR
jgi:hypothetical protein